MFSSRKSISARFVLLLSGLMAFAFLFFAFTITAKNVHTVNAQQLRRMDNIIAFAETSLPTALWQYNSDSRQQACQKRGKMVTTSP